MSLHDHNIAFDRCSAMGYQYYDGDQYYDAPLPTYASDSSSLYQPYSYYIPDNIMLAVPLDPHGEQQLIQTPIQEYHPGNTFVSAPIYSVPPDTSCVASAHVHDAGACSSVQTYYSEGYPPSWVQDVKNSSAHIPSTQSSEYRATIARLSNDFLANASSLFGVSASRTRNASAPLTRPPTPRSGTMRTSEFIPARKRLSEVIEDAQPLGARANTAPTEDLGYLPQPHMIVPSQNNIVQESRGSLHGVQSHDPLRSPHHSVRKSSPDSLLSGGEVRPLAHQPNKRHRSEEITRHSHATTSSPATWPAPGESVMKASAARKTGEQKKQALACLFCRERKIACGRPSAHSPDQTCNQCARRRMKCEYPTESRRGQHKRIRRKPIEETNKASSSTSTLQQSAPNTPLVGASTT